MTDLHSQPAEDTDRFFVCLTCGHLKHEDLFRGQTDPTCALCRAAGSDEINWTKDGGTYVAVDGSADCCPDCGAVMQKVADKRHSSGYRLVCPNSTCNP